MLMSSESLKELANAVFNQWEKDGYPEDFNKQDKDMYDFLRGIDDAKQAPYNYRGYTNQQSDD